MMNGAASERSTARLECNEQFISMYLADRRANVGGVLQNSYDVGHLVATSVENAISMIGLATLTEPILFDR